MNLKACCGLLASKEDEDHDYDAVDHKILPKPRAAVERGRKGSVTNIYANAGYFAKANSMAAAAAEAEAEAAARRSFVELGREDTTERDIQKAAWEAGAAASVASGPPPGQRQNADDADDEPNIPKVEKLTVKVGEKGEGHHAKGGGGGAGASGVPGVSVSIGSISRETSGVSSFSSTNSRGYPVSHGAFGQGGRSISSGSAGGREGSKKWETISTTRSKAKDGDESGQTGVRVGSGKGWNAAAGGLGGSGGVDGGYKRAPVPTVEAPAASRFDLAGFVAWLGKGVLLTKINRQGRAKVRTLFYDEQNSMLWWNGPGASGRFGSGSQRSRSSSLMSLRKEQPLPLASLIEVRMASQMDEPFCFDSDVDNSLQLVFPSRTVDLVAKNEEEAALLARGFQELKASVA